MSHSQILHSDTTTTGTASGYPVEMYEDIDGDYVVEVAGVPVVIYSNQTEARGVFYLLSNMSAAAIDALRYNAATDGFARFPVQS